MAIKVNGTNVITDARALNNITSVDSTTATAITNAGVGGSGTSVGAWVNFGMFGGTSIRDDDNVSSITNNGVGDETVNFSSSFVDDDYAFCVGANTDGTTHTGLPKGGARANGYNDPPTTMTTSALRLLYGKDGDIRDFNTASLMVVR